MDFFDTHCHLDFPDFNHDCEAVIARAEATGLLGMLTIGTCAGTSAEAVKLAQGFPSVHAAVGIHPNHCSEAEDDDFLKIADLARADQVLAIGETGLDFYRERTSAAKQRDYFIKHLELALLLDKPVVIHSRNSGNAVMGLLESFPGVDKLRGVFHCFTDSKEVLQRALALNLKIGVSGIVTFPKADKVRELAKIIPDDHLLLDSDSPFLAPVPKRGKRNEPAYVTHIAQALAEFRGVSLQDIARITTRNAYELFFRSEIREQPDIAYVIRNTLYLALTNACTNNCGFCARNQAYRVKGHNIKLEHEPEANEVIAAMGDTSGYEGICFCGFGEPTLRLEVLKTVARELQDRKQRVRLNTNGQANLFWQRNIVPELVGLVDTVSVSLNTADPVQYNQLCCSQFAENAYADVCDFVLEAVKCLPEVVCTVVEMPGIDVAAARKKAEDLGAKFRLRSFVDVG